ncbi:unnamed protein product [Phytophthora fragariaefolia]|uniref:Unnamed protein product n=1 Tax=Phytophthora fragariaefolia TaxID=1490495 RepID=A0A9W6U9Q5_9STRA|nr:unnamed protein product [Phytophthora fragariaefolia]
MYQDAATFSAKTKPLRVAAANADLLFLDGPFTVVPPILTRQSKRASASGAASSKPKRVRCAKKTTEFRAWWRPLGIHQEDPGSLDEDRAVLLSFLRAKLDEVGDVDGVVGFSQGASVAAWMCSHQARAELQWSPKLAVLIGSYVASPQYSLDSGVVPDIASLHVFGSNDYVIPAAKSQQVVDIFKQEEVRLLDARLAELSALTLGCCLCYQTIDNRVLTSVHTHGHVVPKCDASRELVESFLALQQLRLLGSPSLSPSASSDVVEREDLTPSEALASQRVCAL